MSGEKKVQELHNSSTDEGPKSIKDDAIFHTFGLERRGSVRGLGFGALPSKFDAQVHQNEHVRKLKGKALDLEQQLDEIRAMLIKERRQNDVRGKAKHDNIMFDDLIPGTNPSQRSFDLLQSTPHDNLPTSVNEVGLYIGIKVRTKLESLDGIVPPSHGFFISSTAMKNVWLSMEHQVILWCNQLVVQVLHTFLSLMDPEAGQPFCDTQKRLAAFTKMLHSGMPLSSNWLRQSLLPQQATHDPVQDGKKITECTRPNSSERFILCGDSNGGKCWISAQNANDVRSQGHTLAACPSNVCWTDDGLERDLYIQTSSVTVLAMDSRRWEKLIFRAKFETTGSNGKGHFVLVTNLVPCSGIRLHLWPEKGKSASDLPVGKRVLEVTQKMVHIPSGLAPRQIEPGSQTEQAPPSAVFLLAPGDMHGFRFLTIAVAPSPTVSRRPPLVASMAIGQFFSPEDGELELSAQLLLLSTYSPKNPLMFDDWFTNHIQTLEEIWEFYEDKVLRLSRSLVELLNQIIDFLNDIHQRNSVNSNLLNNLRICRTYFGSRQLRR
ncbi:unnamed protein product [Camellia sinensis]